MFYTDELLGANKSNNLKNNYYTYKDMVEEEIIYKKMLEEENEVLQRFDEIAKTVQETQREEEILYKNNKALEEEKLSLFFDFETKPETIDKKLNKISEQNEKNLEEANELRKKYVEALSIFLERQNERNQCARKKKGIDRNHMHLVTKTRRLFETIDIEEVKKVKNFKGKDKTEIKENLLKIMMENGKNEKVPFDENVLRNAIEIRIDIANKEAQCYILIYDRLRKLLNEIENDNILIAKYEKALRDVTAKLNFLNAEKEYIVGFLDNERMTAMNGVKIHKKMMDESCKNFEADIKQIDNLYELIIREASNKSTKKAYKELYNSTYLRDIEEKERDFEEEITNVRIRTGAVINSNYWRIESIKNIYTVFRSEVTEKFARDLSEYEDVIGNIEIKTKNEYIENLYEDLETPQEEKYIDNIFEDELENEYEDNKEEEIENLNFDDLEEENYDEIEEIEELEDDGLDIEFNNNELEEIEDEEEEFDDDLDFNIFDKSDYEDSYEPPSYERNKRMYENKNQKRMSENGIHKRTLRIKKTNISNNNNEKDIKTNKSVEHKMDRDRIIIDDSDTKKENVNEILTKEEDIKEKNKIIKSNSKKEKSRKKRKKQKSYSNNTSNTEFSTYLNNALHEEAPFQGITELNPKSEKKKNTGIFNKLRKTNKALKNSGAVKNT